MHTLVYINTIEHLSTSTQHGSYSLLYVCHHQHNLYIHKQGVLHKTAMGMLLGSAITSNLTMRRHMIYRLKEIQKATNNM